MRPRIRTAAPQLVGVLALLASWGAIQAGNAFGNEFHDFACEDPYTGQAAPTYGWSYQAGSSGYGDGAGSNCSGGNGAISAYMDGAVTHAFGEAGVATFTAPGALTIDAFKLWRYEAVGPSEPYASPATGVYYFPGSVSVDGLCAQSNGCVSKGTSQNRLAAQNQLSVSNLSGTTNIQAVAMCGGGPGTPNTCPASNAESGNSAEIDLYAADITLSDPTLPSVTNVSGPLVSGNTLSGNVSIAFTATDNDGPGIYSGTISVDGQPVVTRILDTNGGACQSLGATNDGLRSFNAPQPCKPQVSSLLTLDAAQLQPGIHESL